MLERNLKNIINAYIILLLLILYAWEWQLIVKNSWIIKMLMADEQQAP